MKKSRIALLAILAGMVCLFLCAACGSFSKQLSVPKNLQIDEYDILTWEEVPGAEKYLVSINDEDYQTDACKLDIFMLTATPGVYKISVSALGDLQNTFDSGWSAEFIYNVQDAEGLVAYGLIDNDTAYTVAAACNVIEGSPAPKGKLVIPSEYKGLPVTEVYTSGFANCMEITSVILPESISSIGAYAFKNCEGMARIKLPIYMEGKLLQTFKYCTKLTEIDLPHGISSLNATFGGGLKRLVIPATVTEIAWNTFVGCDQLEDLTVEEGNPVYKSDGNCILSCEDNTLMIGISSSVIPEYVTTIGANAFAGCKDLTSIIIPRGVTNMIGSPFSRCDNITNLKVAEGNPVYRSEGNCIIKRENNELVNGCKNSVIPADVKIIGESAFNSSGITSLVLPHGVTSIELGAFSACRALTSIVIPNTVTYIASDAFQLCEALTSIEIPGSVKSIGDMAFSRSGIASLKICNGVTEIGEYAFSACVNLKNVRIPVSVTSIGDAAFYNNDYTHAVTLSKNVEVMPDRIFTISTVYAEHSEKPNGWGDYTDFYDTILWGCTLVIEEGYPYVESYTYSRGAFEPGCFPPEIPSREGYTFAGWATEKGSKEVVYGTYDYVGEYSDFAIGTVRVSMKITLPEEDRQKIPEGTTLYAVWIPENG